MRIYEIILIGVALAMDAFALTVSNCTVYKNTLSKSKKIAMPVTFAIFQFLMPVLGYFVGSAFASYLKGFAGYLTAIVFFALAVKFLFDAIAEKKSDGKEKKTVLSPVAIILQGVATSIDALFIGVTFAVELTFSIFLAAGIIGIVTFVIVFLALLVGKGLGKVLKDYSAFFGVAILLALAIINLVKAIG